MGIITFLKERRKEALVKKLSKLEKLANDYGISTNCYNNQNCDAFSKATFFLNSSFCSYCYTEALTSNYNLYDYYPFLYNKTVAKIEKLKRKLQRL